MSSVKFQSQQVRGFGDHLVHVRSQEHISVSQRNLVLRIFFQNGTPENLDVPATMKSETLRASKLSTG